MRILLFLGVAFGLAACGGNVLVDGTGTGGTTTTTSETTTTSTGTTTFTTTTGTGTTTTTMTTTTTTEPGCAVPFPGIEAPCMVEGQVCPVPLSCCSGSALCHNGFWTFQPIPCGQPCELACGPGGFSCQGGAVCGTYIGMETTYTCEKDPCPPGPLSCSCAEPICQQHGLTCNNIQGGYKVLCD
jgi:hypothetical protein